MCLTDLAKLTGKHLYWSLAFCLRYRLKEKREFSTGIFLCVVKVFKNNIFKEDIWVTDYALNCLIASV